MIYSWCVHLVASSEKKKHDWKSTPETRSFFQFDRIGAEEKEDTEDIEKEEEKTKREGTLCPFTENFGGL